MMGAAASWPTAIKEFFNNLLHYVIGRTGSLSTRNFISAAQTGQTAYAVQTWNAVSANKDTRSRRGPYPPPTKLQNRSYFVFLSLRTRKSNHDTFLCFSSTYEPYIIYFYGHDIYP
jgi:hypothetical protein